MKKTFFNISTRGGDLQTPTKTKRKFLKTFSFTGLALLMGAAGVFAFAPLGTTTTPIANANEMIESTTTSGLGLDPKNDPVVYTTESGLEIKMSNASNTIPSTITVTTNRGYSYTQDLTSFYYFTMGTYSGTIYTAVSQSSTYTVSNEPINWIILGLGPNTSYFLDSVTANIFSTWKTNTNGVNVQYSNAIGGPYFFKEIFETTTPAGSAINSVVPSKSYVMEKVKTSIKTHSDIPDGHMLVISEKLLGSMYFNAKGAINYAFYSSSGSSPNVNINRGQGTYGYGNRYRYIANNDVSTSGHTWTTTDNAGGSLYNYINTLFSKNNSTGAIISNGLGFTQAQANLIVPQQLYTYYSNGSANLQETPETDGGTYYTMFPLARRNACSSIYQNFCIEDYMDTNAKRIGILIGSSNNQAMFWYTRSGLASYGHAVNSIWPYGDYNTGHSGALYAHGVRPAMVMKLK